MYRKRRLILSALALLLVSSAACGSGPRGLGGGTGTKASRSAGKVDPCKLVTQQEAEAAVGEPLGAAVREGSSSDLTCTYQAGDGYHSLTITETRSADLRQGKTPFTLTRAAFGNVAQEVHGIGDDAFIANGLNIIFVLAGDTFFSIQFVDQSLLGLGGEDAGPKLMAIARRAVTRV